MFLVDLVKELYGSLRHPTGRFNYLQGMLRNLPGQVGMKLRSRILPKYFASCGENLSIQEGVRFINIHKVSLGSHIVLGNGSFLQGAGGIEIGDHVLLGPDVKIWSTNHRFDDVTKPILEQGYENKKITIERHVWLGANVIVLPGVHLPEGCIVSAGSVVGIKKYPPFSILAGNPARVVGNRLKQR